MAIAFVGGAASASTTGVNTITVSYSPTAGNTVFAGIAANISGDRITGMTASNSVSLTQDSKVAISAHDNSEMYWYRYSSVPAGITSFTATYNTTAANLGMAVVEFSSVATSSPLDVADTVGNEAAFGTTWSSGAVTTTNANDVVLGLAWCGFDLLSGSGSWTTGAASANAAAFNVVAVYQIVSSTSTYTPSGTAAGFENTTAIGISYKAAGGVSTSLKLNSSLSGLGSSGPFFHDRLA